MKKLLFLFAILCCTLNALAFDEPEHVYRWSWIKDQPANLGDTPVDQLLKKISTSMTPMVCQFNEENILIGKEYFTLKQSNTGYTSIINSGNGKWLCETVITPDKKNCYKIEATFTLLEGSSDAAAVAMSFDVKGWSKDNFVLIPSAAYNGNRFAYYPVVYPCSFRNKGDSKPGDPPYITDIAKLSVTDKARKMENAAGDASTPMIGFWDKAKQKNFFVFTEYGTSLGQSGLFVEENKSFNEATIVISAPSMREYYTGFTQQVKSNDKAPSWKAGDRTTINMYVKVDDSSKDIASFYEQFMVNRKVLTGQNKFRNFTTYSKAWEAQEYWQNTPNRFYEAGGYYKNGNGESIYGHMQLGWVGGLMQEYSLIIRGNERSRNRSFMTINKCFDVMQDKTGFMHGVSKDGIVYGDILDYENQPDIAMTRKNGDALYFMLKQLSYIKDYDVEFAQFDKIEKCVKKLADAFVNLYNRYGEVGQLVDVKTGEMFAYGSTAGAIVPSALSYAYKYFGDEKYLEVAKKIAQQYYDRDVINGYTTGGPGEILQCPDSESGFAMLESFMVLYEVTKDKKWLEYAKEMANICSSWVVSYDFKFPEQSYFGKKKVRSTGAVWASIQNRHAGPGACTTSADCLLKLYRATGNEFYLSLLKDMAHNTLEFMSTKEDPITCKEDGLVSERVNISDWEGTGSIGHVFECNSTSWCEVAIMQTITEIPSIYIQTDKQKVVCFDHLEAKVISKDGDGIVLEVTNSTKHNANAAIFAETSSAAKKNMMHWNLYPRLPKINLSPSETKRYKVKHNGDIINM